MKQVLWFVALLLACKSNSNQSTKEINDTSIVEVPDQPLVVEDTVQVKSIQKAKAPIGVYEAIIPCTDCKSIVQTVSFQADQTFQLQQEKSGKPNSLNVTKGSWKITDSLIWLYKEQVAIARYSWLGDTLVVVDAKTGKVFPAIKKQSARDNKVWRVKKQEGLEFFGIGNEPFWSIEIDEQKAINFQLADWEKPVLLKPGPPVINADSIVYKTTDSDSLSVTIYNRFCSDGMSDFIYDNEVKVIYNKQVYKGCGLLYK